MATPVALGIDIGGTKIAAAIVRPDGSMSLPYRVPTPAALGPVAIMQAAIAAGRQVLGGAQEEGSEVVGIGVGSAGHVDYTHGTITYAAGTLPGWAGTRLGREVERALGLPVVVDNDVNAMAAGESRFGAGRFFSHALYITVGTGVGGAIVHGGEIWRGASWTAGEIGHLLVDWDGARRCSCGRTGHLEAYAAGPAIARRYCSLATLEAPVDLRAIAERARAGDTLARDAIAEGARILGLALGGLLSTLDPQALIVGGGGAELDDLWWQPLEAAIRGGPMPGPARIALRRAELGVDAVLVGAGWLALTRFAPSLLDQQPL